MHLSVFDLFTIGIGPSSSHTVGPMRAARVFAQDLLRNGQIDRVSRVQATAFGSLGATGKGHGTDKALILGLQGETPEEIDVAAVPALLDGVKSSGTLMLAGHRAVPFNERTDLTFERMKTLPGHPNALHFAASDDAEQIVAESIFYSTGGGFIVRDGETPPSRSAPPYPIGSAKELLAHCASTGLSISAVVMENEKTWLPEAEIRARLDRIWQAMQLCVRAGCRNEGTLPGGLKVQRRAPGLHRALTGEDERALRDPLTVLDWVNLYALAVNEENAAGGRVVTAPTNGAAGIIPAVLHYADRFCSSPHPDGVHRFLLTSAVIGMLYKKNASISGADVGCQGEVGVACSMAAGALVEFFGGTPLQVENAAEIGMEHNLGLTCDPIGGLVQIPCIERNAMGSIKAINAARIARRGDGQHFVSLDKVILTMLETGRDMQSKYKETSRGGLAVNVVEC